jgi:hypothetical protein
MAVDVNLVAFSSGDGKEVRIKGLFRRVGGDIVEGLIVSVKVGGINVDAGLCISSSADGFNMSNDMLGHGNNGVGLIPTVQDTTSGAAEKQVSIVVGVVRMQSQGTYGTGRHRVVGFLSDLHIFSRRKLTIFVLDQCPSNEGARPKEVMDAVVGWKHIEQENNTLDQVDNQLARPEAEGAIGNSTVCTLFDGADVTFDFRHVLILIATFQVQREILPQRLKFRVTMDTSDLEATVGINSGNAVDAVRRSLLVCECRSSIVPKQRCLEMDTRKGIQLMNTTSTHRVMAW